MESYHPSIHLTYETDPQRDGSRFRETDIDVCVQPLSRRDESYWNGGKKMAPESEVRLGGGAEYSRQQNRFTAFTSTARDRGRFQEPTAVQPASFDRYEDPRSVTLTRDQ